ncbi:MAG: hypothetical protein NDF54_00950 [archaeon GB-1867-035]|nr:hypothetical protein [Candidatus Culexmicrobium profundum]
MSKNIKLSSLPLLIIILLFSVSLTGNVLGNSYRVVDLEKIKRIETDTITIIFPRDGRKPTFI